MYDRCIVTIEYQYKASKRTPLKRHEETEKWNEMKDEQKYEMELFKVLVKV